MDWTVPLTILLWGMVVLLGIGVFSVIVLGIKGVWF